MAAVVGSFVVALCLPLSSSAGPHAADPAPRIRGVDLSFTLEEEAAGKLFDGGRAHQPVEAVLAAQGGNFVRLHVWVAAVGLHGDVDAVLTMARRARAVGMGLLLNLHYSDSWADRHNQNIPRSWQRMDLPTLAETVREYTRDVVGRLARQGTPVDLVQIGNEVSNGFLWPAGRVDDAGDRGWQDFTALLRAGIAGARDGQSQRLRVVVHVDGGGNNPQSRHFFDRLTASGVDFDVIGLSYYPFWDGPLRRLQDNLNDLAGRYRKDVLVAETSYPWTLADGDGQGNVVSAVEQLPEAARFPATEQGQADYFEALRSVVTQVPGGRGAGFFVWAPEWLPGVGAGPGYGNGYDNLTMFRWDGTALPSVRALRPPD